MKHRNSLVMLLLAIFISLAGCGSTNGLSGYDFTGLSFIAYQDIDTVCENEALINAGSRLLSDQGEALLLSYVVDSAIELTDSELGQYDHLVLTNPMWVERFGDPDKLKPIEYQDVSPDMQKFLDSQMPILTVDGRVLSEGMGLYEYEGETLLAFPVNATLGAADPIEAENPLLVLIDDPAAMLKADSCMLPLTSSGNVLFSDSGGLREAFSHSALQDYGEVQSLNIP